jgi:hypothetical protein
LSYVDQTLTPPELVRLYAEELPRHGWAIDPDTTDLFGTHPLNASNGTRDVSVCIGGKWSAVIIGPSGKGSEIVISADYDTGPCP